MAAKNCIKLYASGTTTADNVATITIPQPGQLTAILGHIRNVGSTPATVIIVWQISLMSASAFATNDARNIIAEFASGQNDVTAGKMQVENVGVYLPGIRLTAGDKLCMHRSVAGTVTVAVADLNLIIV